MIVSVSDMALPSTRIRQEFPILRGEECIYLDSAATAQKPEAVLHAMDTYYRTANANAHRSMHVLAERATQAYESAKATVANFIGANPFEIVFTKNCTEAINLVAASWGKMALRKGDTVVLSVLEHHSNIIPWLMLKEEIGITVEWIGIHDDGNIRMDDVDRLLQTGTVKLIALSGLSNVLGTVSPLKEIITRAHAANVKVLVDAAQLIVHSRVNIRELDCDFLVFSGHKLYGPTGIGVLYAKRELLETMPPFLGGGMMIGTVDIQHFTPADIPAKFEAGTQPVAEAVGLRAAIDWMAQFDRKDTCKHETDLLLRAYAKLKEIEGVHILCDAQNYELRIMNYEISGCLSFTIDGIHPHDLTHLIGNPEPRTHPPVCLRAGHLCAQPLHRHLGINASTRLSLGIYNNEDDIDAAVTAIQKAVTTLRP